MERNWLIERLQDLTNGFKVAFGGSGTSVPNARGMERGRPRDGERAPGLRDGGPRAALLRLRASVCERPYLREELAQGTTEYAILVGVLVVIAIVAIIAFRDKVSALWEAISSGINSL